MPSQAPQPDSNRQQNPQRGNFATTQWSVVVAAGAGDFERSAAALEKLCRQYWPPIHAFVRRRVSDRHEAEDLTQAFFAHLLDKESIKKADPGKGKFRTFLLASLTNFLANEWDKRKTIKRGGQHQIISLHEVTDEVHERVIDNSVSPEKLFDRRWAVLLVETVQARLKTEYSEQQRGAVCEKLLPALTGEMDSGWHAAVAAELGLNEGSVRVALHRLRRRFGDLLREEVSRTVSNSEEIGEEIRHLFAVMSE